MPGNLPIVLIDEAQCLTASTRRGYAIASANTPTKGEGSRKKRAKSRDSEESEDSDDDRSPRGAKYSRFAYSGEMDASEHRPVFVLFDRVIRLQLRYPMVASGTSLRMRQVVELMGSNTLKGATHGEQEPGSPCEEPIVLPLPYLDEDRVYKLLNYWLDLTLIDSTFVADVCHALTGE